MCLDAFALIHHGNPAGQIQNGVRMDLRQTCSQTHNTRAPSRHSYKLATSIAHRPSVTSLVDLSAR